MNYDDHRREYVLGGLRSEALSATPLGLFSQWQQQAIDAGLKDPTAAVLATRETSGLLWQRIVLLKGVAEDGFVFFTNYDRTRPRRWRRMIELHCCFPGMNWIGRSRWRARS